MAGGLIRELADEAEGQQKALEKFSVLEFPRARRGSIFAGAGDSYAAALAGFYASGGRCMALDPYFLASAPELADGADVYFISVSGRTSSNAQAAKKVRSRAKRISVLTAVADSRLAGLADRVVELPISYKPRTPGILSFSLSLLAVLRIAGAGGHCDFSGALRAAEKRRFVFSEGRGTTYFLSNSMAQPAALYAAAKTYEILGAKAQAEFLEEFSHLELFSLDKSDAVNSFACFDPSGLARKLGGALAEQGYECNVVRSWGKSPVDQLFHAVFVAQLSVLQTAKEKGLTEPRFLSARRALDASDAMIY
jgi:hypothetical protein